MSPALERLLLQGAVAIASLVPLTMGGLSILRGADLLKGMDPPFPVDLDSHYRYLSGLLLGIGLVFLASITAPRVRKTVRRRSMRGIEARNTRPMPSSRPDR